MSMNNNCTWTTTKTGVLIGIINVNSFVYQCTLTPSNIIVGGQAKKGISIELLEIINSLPTDQFTFLYSTNIVFVHYALNAIVDKVKELDSDIIAVTLNSRAHKQQMLYDYLIKHLVGECHKKTEVTLNVPGGELVLIYKDNIVLCDTLLNSLKTHFLSNYYKSTI